MSLFNSDPELIAIQSIVSALEPLDVNARQRILTYVFQRLRLSVESQPETIPTKEKKQQKAAVTRDTLKNKVDIRTLKEQKSPSSAIEMCTLVAYYLAELAPIEERKINIDKNDVEKYFNQAGFQLPKAVKQALPNAAKAGYFDMIGGGKYRLNPAGYKLVAQELPAKQEN